MGAHATYSTIQAPSNPNSATQLRPLFLFVFLVLANEAQSATAERLGAVVVSVVGDACSSMMRGFVLSMMNKFASTK